MSEESNAGALGSGPEQDVRSQLGRYWLWVEESSGLELAAGRQRSSEAGDESFAARSLDGETPNRRTAVTRPSHSEVSDSEISGSQVSGGEVSGGQVSGGEVSGRYAFDRESSERCEVNGDAPEAEASELVEFGEAGPVVEHRARDEWLRRRQDGGLPGSDGLSETRDLDVELLDLLNVGGSSTALMRSSSPIGEGSEADIDVVIRRRGFPPVRSIGRVLVAVWLSGIAVFSVVKAQPWATSASSELAVDASASTTSAASLPSDPEGALFVLPNEDSELVAQNGELWGQPSVGTSEYRRILVLGIKDGSVYRDLINVRILDAPTDLEATTNDDRVKGADNPGSGLDRVDDIEGTSETRTDLELWLVSVREEWDVIELSTGPAYVDDEVFGLNVVQRKGTRMVVVQASEERGMDRLIELMEGISVDDDGELSIESSLGFTVLDDFRSQIIGPGQGLSFSVDVNSSGALIEVESANAPTPIAGVAMIGGEVSSMQVAGHDAWFLEVFDSDWGMDGEQDGPYRGVAWQATANRIVAVSGNVSLEELLVVAEALEIVDEAAWLEVFPDAG